MFDDRPPLTRRERLQATVRGTPLDVIVKWAIIVIAAVETVSFIQGELTAVWATLRGWW